MNLRTMIAAGILALGMVTPVSAVTTVEILTDLEDDLAARKAVLGTIAYKHLDPSRVVAARPALFPDTRVVKALKRNRRQKISYDFGTVISGKARRNLDPVFFQSAKSKRNVIYFDDGGLGGLKKSDLTQLRFLTIGLMEDLFFKIDSSGGKVAAQLTLAAPVPLPTSLPLLLGGLGLLTVLRRRRR